MAYTEIKERNGKKYYYRVISLRNGNKISKKRKYLGVDLSDNSRLSKEREADRELNVKKEIRKKEIIEKLKRKIIKILRKNKIKRAGIFGSYASGKAKKNSDIDILIMPSKSMSLLDLSGLKIELEDKLNKKVDLISYKYIHPHLKDRILKSEFKIM